MASFAVRTLKNKDLITPRLTLFVNDPITEILRIVMGMEICVMETLTIIIWY